MASANGGQEPDDDELRANAEYCFSLLDKNNDGFISQTELGSLVRALGFNPTEEEIKRLTEKLDVDNSGRVDFKEFSDFYIDYYKKISPKQEIRQAFNVFDKNKDGYIHKDELKLVLTKLGDKGVNDAEVDEMIALADVDEDGRICIKEFTDFMCGK